MSEDKGCRRKAEVRVRCCRCKSDYVYDILDVHFVNWRMVVNCPICNAEEIVRGEEFKALRQSVELGV